MINPPFDAFWSDKQPNHLPFLHLEDDNKAYNARQSIEKLKSVLSKTSPEELLAGLSAIIKQDEWRLHLVACLTLLIKRDLFSAEIQEILWWRLSQGSWVSPQIAVTLAEIDNQFQARAQAILKAQAAVVSPAEAAEFQALERIKRNQALDYLTTGNTYSADPHDNGALFAKDWKEHLRSFF